MKIGKVLYNITKEGKRMTIEHKDSFEGNCMLVFYENRYGCKNTLLLVNPGKWVFNVSDLCTGNKCLKKISLGNASEPTINGQLLSHSMFGDHYIEYEVRNNNELIIIETDEFSVFFCYYQ